MTLLLVSARNVSEALAAARGGADIIDVKNPKEGSLGASFPWIIAKIRQTVPPEIPVSAAIGDFPDLPGSAALAAFGSVKAGANIVKVGLKGSKDVKSAAYLVRQVVRAVEDVKPAKVVACAYGDFKRAGTLDPVLIPKIAWMGGAKVAMLDTAVKDGGTLLDFLSAKELRDFIQEAHSRGLGAALAGSLGPEELSQLKRLGPDVIGIRGAACEFGDRERGRMSQSRVRRLKKLLEA